MTNHETFCILLDSSFKTASSYYSRMTPFFAIQGILIGFVFIHKDVNTPILVCIIGLIIALFHMYTHFISRHYNMTYFRAAKQWAEKCENKSLSQEERKKWEYIHETLKIQHYKRGILILNAPDAFLVLIVLSVIFWLY